MPVMVYFLGDEDERHLAGMFHAFIPRFGDYSPLQESIPGSKTFVAIGDVINLGRDCRDKIVVLTDDAEFAMGFKRRGSV